jgi:hypothetical protein
MNKCRNPDHPHCTVWVMPGADSCVHGHLQPVPAAAESAPATAPIAAPVPVAPLAANSFEMITALRQRRDDAPAGIHPRHPGARRPHLRISGFDPRASGGRQSIKLDLRALSPGAATQLQMTLESDLFPHGSERHTFVRSVDGDWRPVFVEFSSRGLEHGQYRIDVELRSDDVETRAPRTWVCTLMILVPRLDASLTDIHQTFLATHKNVRVMADDAGIARVNAPGSASMNIDVTARNASVAHVNLDEPAGKIDHSIGTIAWDEDLIEIAARRSEPHSFPATAASLVNAAPDTGAPRHVRLFALDECVLGRWEDLAPECDVMLSHYGRNGQEGGQDKAGLTRRLSARHAVIRRGARGYEIEDVSRYGILLDGVWPGKNQPIPLRLGMRIECTASIKGVVVLEVGALLPNGVILNRIDQGSGAECVYLMAPECHPGFPLPHYPCAPRACAMPVLFHRDGGFWHLDVSTGRETSLGPATLVDRLSRFGRHLRFAGTPYPEDKAVRTTERRRELLRA